MALEKRIRDKIIRCRCNADEQKRFHKVAELRHTDISEVIRQALHKEADALGVPE